MYEYKKYRVEWVVEVCETDQYGMPDKSILYSKPYPTRELAEAGLKEITHPDKYVKDRLVWNDAPHRHCYCHIRYREVEVKNENLSD